MVFFFSFTSEFVAASGLPITAKQAKKKWNNLKDKYKVISLLICNPK